MQHYLNIFHYNQLLKKKPQQVSFIFQILLFLINKHLQSILQSIIPKYIIHPMYTGQMGRAKSNGSIDSRN